MRYPVCSLNAFQNDVPLWEIEQVDPQREISLFSDRNVPTVKLDSFREWVEKILELRGKGHTLVGCDDVRTLTMGFVDDDENVCYEIPLRKVKEISSEERDLLFPNFGDQYARSLFIEGETPEVSFGFDPGASTTREEEIEGAFMAQTLFPLPESDGVHEFVDARHLRDALSERGILKTYTRPTYGDGTLEEFVYREKRSGTLSPFPVEP